MKELTREEKREKLINSWNEFTEGFLYAGADFSYRKCCNLIRKTREYFDTLPVSIILTTEDCRLYEAASALRFMPDSYCPNGAKKEEFCKACLKVTEMFAALEAMPK